MPDERVADVLEEMAPDEAADLLAELPEERSQESAQPDGAGRGRGCAQAAGLSRGHRRRHHDHRVRRRPPRPDGRAGHRRTCARRRTRPRRSTTSTSPTRDDRLVGVFSLQDLVLAQPETPVARLHARPRRHRQPAQTARTTSPRSSPSTTCWPCRWWTTTAACRASSPPTTRWTRSSRPPGRSACRGCIVEIKVKLSRGSASTSTLPQPKAAT